MVSGGWDFGGEGVWRGGGGEVSGGVGRGGGGVGWWVALNLRDNDSPSHDVRCSDHGHDDLRHANRRLLAIVFQKIP